MIRFAVKCVLIVSQLLITAPLTAGINKKGIIQISNIVSSKIVEVNLYNKYESFFANYGVLTFAAQTKNDVLIKKVIDNYQNYFKNNTLEPGHVDKNAMGILGFELYLQTKNPEYLKIPLILADDEWQNPRDDGLTKYSRFWTDDVFMVAVLQVQAYKATGKEIYLDRAIKQITAYAEKLQQQNGLFQHTLKSPVFWGRANGWAASALTITLDNTPANHPQRQTLMDIYTKLMNAILKYQDDDGLWHQVLLDNDSFKETSCTAMFVFSFADGVNSGRLDKKFQSAAEKGWNGLTKKIENGLLLDVCCGTDENGIYDYYLNRPRITGDFHGAAPLLWASTELLK
ncbi:MAG: glycoside hydrolase family 88 protein [Phycisphaerales bacterium]